MSPRARVALVALALAVAGVVAWRRLGIAPARAEARCGAGFRAEGPRCLFDGCPAPLAAGPGGCDAPPTRVLVPAARFVVGPSDWEAQGAVAAREVVVAPFLIDAFEVTAGAWRAAPTTDGAMAASRVTYDEAASFCLRRGGALPSEDQWLAAAAGPKSTRYPWGETGAVCRRAAWGLAAGPCAYGAVGPDTVGAHPDGATASGIHDLAGNVAEWTAAPPAASVAAVRGGSWRTELATELRTWARREVDKASRRDDVGFRCVYVAP